MAKYPGYAQLAVRAEEYAELAPSRSVAESYRKVADSYWALDRRPTEMKYQRELRRTPKVNGC